MLEIKIADNKTIVKANGSREEILEDLCCANASLLSQMSSGYKELAEMITEMSCALLMAVKEGKIKPEGGKK